ncbi:P-loop NTPase fold protein [Anaerofustis sp. HA2171]|uniref:P-loop NTPase fold protein n=1 Tax=Anaerofustis butyriciformans TaxID=3108533 RepID=UPI002E337606|nr:P-loop NTPase fold protein [Anaerofustis sp. HA2171]
MYYNDKPIKQFDEDVLGRASFAKNLATALTNLKGETYTIGLYGKWGSGKTSIINMMLKELENQGKNKNDDDKFIIVKFEPWNFSDNEQLINQFFIRLASEFRSKEDEKRDQIGDALINYSYALELSKLLPFAGSVIAPVLIGSTKKLGKKLKNNIDEKDIIKQKQYVIDRLKKNRKNILIIIDDIDRLSSEQIRQVFQLVAYVANFPNTIYLLSFDKDVVVKSLEKVQEGNGEEYLEKVIQMPIQVPKMKNNVVINILIAKLSQIIDINNLDENEYKYFIESLNYISPFISGIRDVNRLYNTFYFKYKGIASEINFTDMLCLIFLEINFNKVYEWIKNNKDSITAQYVIVKESENSDELYKRYFDIIKNLIYADNIINIENENRTRNILNLISYIFPYINYQINIFSNYYQIDDYLKYNRIAHPDKFDRYFSLDIDDNDIRSNDILNVLQILNYDQLKEIFISYYNKGVLYDFFEEIKVRIREIEKERIKIILNVLIDFSFYLNRGNPYLGIFPEDNFDNFILDLIRGLPKEERFICIKELINRGNLQSLYTSTKIVILIEWGYGRLTDTGIEYDLKKVITLDELFNIEEMFKEKVKRELDSFSLFLFAEWKYIFYLIESFDEEYIKTYVKKMFLDKKNIIKFIEYFVGHYVGSSFNVDKDKYEKYLSKDEIINAINEIKKSEEFFDLEEYVQYCCAAFILKNNKKVNDFGYVRENDIKELLEQWKKEYEENNKLLTE